jgi:hypothetical protein
VAEAMVLICDECGRPEATSITIRAGGKSYVKDLCSQHLSVLLKDTRSPRRGRPKTTASAGRGRPRAGGTQDTPRKRKASKASTSRRRQRRRKPAKSTSA